MANDFIPYLIAGIAAGSVGTLIVACVLLRTLKVIQRRRQPEYLGEFRPPQKVPGVVRNRYGRQIEINIPAFEGPHPFNSLADMYGDVEYQSQYMRSPAHAFDPMRELDYLTKPVRFLKKADYPHQRDITADGWYFLDEISVNFYGPYATEEIAREELARYCETYLGGDADA